MSWKAKTPSLVVVVLWSIPVALSVALTAAFGTTPPDGSVTVPLIAPRNVCAFPPTASDNTTRIAKTRRFIVSTPPLIEIELTTDSTRVSRPAGARLEKSKSMPSHMTNRSHSAECSNSVVENKDKPPGPARPLRFNKTIQLYGQYGYGV